MRLIDNKGYKTNVKVHNRLFWNEDNVWDSNNNIWYKQDIHRVTTSNNLIENIYHEIRR
jgi:transposase-like protein